MHQALFFANRVIKPSLCFFFFLTYYWREVLSASFNPDRYKGISCHIFYSDRNTMFFIVFSQIHKVNQFLYLIDFFFWTIYFLSYEKIFSGSLTRKNTFSFLIFFQWSFYTSPFHSASRIQKENLRNIFLYTSLCFKFPFCLPSSLYYLVLFYIYYVGPLCWCDTKIMKDYLYFPKYLRMTSYILFLIDDLLQ